MFSAIFKSRDVHYGTFRGSGIFQNLYFESRISNPIPKFNFSGAK